MKVLSTLLFTLIIFTTLSGCIEDSNSEVSLEQNQSPIIVGSVFFDSYHNDQTNTTFDNILWINAMSLDYDGQVVQWGVDTNLDGIIDYNLTNHSLYSPQPMTFESEWKNSSSWGVYNDWYVDYCQQWISIIAIDDKGAYGTMQFELKFIWDSENDTCLEQAKYTSDYRGFSFNGADAPGDTGVLVTMSQGAAANFASLDIKVSINGGQGTNCDATCYTEAGTGDQKWSTGEDLAIAADCGVDENGADVENCNVTITVFDNRENTQIGNEVTIAMDEGN
jgi:hypothetical protein